MKNHSKQLPTGERALLAQQLRDHLASYRSANAALHDISWTIADLDQQLRQLADQQREHADPQCARRIADLHRWQTALEDTLLQQMLQADALAAQIAHERTLLGHQAPDTDG